MCCTQLKFILSQQLFVAVHNSHDPTLEGTPKAQAVHTEPDFGKARASLVLSKAKAKTKQSWAESQSGAYGPYNPPCYFHKETLKLLSHTSLKSGSNEFQNVSFFSYLKE